MHESNAGRVNKHGQAKRGGNNKFYKAWENIRRRCREDKNYVGRGIKIEWKNFLEFRDDMLAGYLEHSKKHGGQQTTIERIDNDGNYSKANCRWATRLEQGQNKRGLHKITFKGQTLTLAEWGRKTGISKYTIYTRMKRHGWSVEKALTTKPRA